MRILHIDKFASRTGGGAPSYMLDLVERQRARGHAVEFLATDGQTDLESSYRHLFPERIQLSPPPSGVGARARTVATMVWSGAAARAVEAVVDDFGPDVVHTHNLYHQLSPSVLAPIARRGVRCVMTVHDYKLVCPTYQLTDGSGAHCEACVEGSVRNVVKRRCQGDSLGQSAILMIESGVHRLRSSYRSIDAFLCPSEYLADLMTRAGHGERVRHLAHGYDTAATPVRSGPGTGVAYGGRLSPEKGVDHLIAAVALVPGLELTICGDGPERANLERLASAVGGRIRFLGHVDRTTLLGVFRASAVVAAPSVWAENQPISILDAMASGVPVVAGQSAALRELVRPGVSGLTVDPRDHRALADALLWFQNDPCRQGRIGTSARSMVEERHGLERHLDALEDHYRGVGQATPRALA